MNIREFSDAVSETEISDGDASKVSTLLDTVEDRVVVSDELMAGIYAARLINLCEGMDIDPMEVVAFVEGDLAGDTYAYPESRYEAEYPDNRYEADDEGYLFWGIR
jgi:hypothetical protein